MINTDYVKHDISLAMDLLILGIRSLSNKHTDEAVILRATLNLLEFLSRNISNQEK